MNNPDIAFDSLKQIKQEFDEFLKTHGAASEADTRVKLIDKILTNVCGWPESALKRETHSDSGYSDYILHVNAKRLVVVEAKREGESFFFPISARNRTLKINGPVLTDRNIKQAVSQVRSYCDDNGIRYAIATNGYSWIVFRAIVEDISWREGHARIFPDFDYIESNFTEFWNLLSYEAIATGSLDKEFGISITPERKFYRVLNRLTNPDVPLLRNSLHTQLNPIITHFFEDIADPNQIDTLQNCYVYSESIKTAVNDLSFVIEDSIPKFLKDQQTIDVKQKVDDSGQFGVSIKTAMDKKSGQLFLLLGGIGAGKTTFQKRYQLTVGKKTLDNALWFELDFLKPPVDPGDLEDFVWKTVLEQLRTKYSSPHLETRKNIKRVFKPEIEALRETDLYMLQDGTPQFEAVLTRHLTKWQENLSEYVPRLLALAKPKRDISVVLFFDNVDQLSPFYQSQIFLLAQNVTAKVGSITIVALREESYYTASVQRVFTAYINRKFHIASPPFRKMIGQRIKYVLNLFDAKNDKAKYFESVFNTNLFYQEDKAKISDFLKIVENSIFETNKFIARFVDHICFGNMRMALQMFSTFLVSGATDIDKMIRIYKREGSYTVPFHEFLRSIMLGDRFYYKESESTIINLFECGSERNSSHFTAIRVLSILKSIRTKYDVEGRGYIEINKVISVFENAFNNKEDVIKTMTRLLMKQLVEVNTKSQESITDATHIRVTSSGWYYITFLVHNFSYLDLVLQDTPINNEDVINRLVQSVFNVNNLIGRDEEKRDRMEERFYRVYIFLEYLKREEHDELERFNLILNPSSEFPVIMDGIMEKFAVQSDYIRNKLSQNATWNVEERVSDDVRETFDSSEPDEDE